MKLTTQQVAEFERDGVVQLGRVLSDDEVAEAQRRFRALLDGGVLEDLFAETGQGPRQSHLRINNAWRHDEWYKALLYKPELLDIVASVLGPDIQLLHDQMFYKPAEDAAPTHWHTDNSYWRLTPPHAASIWIALTDVTLDSSCLYMLPGSHREPPEAEEITVFSGKMNLQSLLIDESKLRPFTMPAGHALMHHCQTVHGAYANTSGRERAAHAIHYLQTGLMRGDVAAFTDTEQYPILRG